MTLACNTYNSSRLVARNPHSMAISILKKILSNFSSKTSATKTSHLDLRLNEPETYSEHTKQVFSALQDYLQPKTESSLKSAATSVLTLLPKDKRESTEVWMFFELCVELAEQIPYNHPLQLKLVGLLDYLHLSPQLTSIFEDTDSNVSSSQNINQEIYLPIASRMNETGTLIYTAYWWDPCEITSTVCFVSSLSKL